MKIQLAQMPSLDSQTPTNLGRVLSVIQAASPDTDVIVFPETCLMGFPTPEEIASVAETQEGPSLSAVASAVKDSGVSVVLGFAEEDAGHFFNTTVLISPQGIALKYRKTHLWASDVGVFEAGSQLTTGVWKGVRVGMLICFDIEFPETARALAAQGAELLFVTNANMDPYGPVHRALLIARAMENQVFVAMCNRCGNSDALTFAGESAVIAPTGQVVAALGRDEASLLVDIDTSEVGKSRQDYHYLNQRRLQLQGQVEPLGNGQTHHLIPGTS